MPARYDAIRDALIAKGMPEAQAKTEAARTYQKTRGPGEMELNAAVQAEKRAAKGARIRRDGRYQS